MTEREQQSFKLTPEGPTIYNENSPQNRFTETTHRLETLDGKKVVEVRWYQESGYYVVLWDHPSISPNKFFSTAQELISNKTGKVKPLEKKVFKGLDYGLKDGSLLELDIVDFRPLQELEQEDVVFARFNTPYGDFGCEARQQDRKNGFTVWFITHINLPDELTEFVSNNSGQEIPEDMLKELLKTVGTQADQRVLEKVRSQRAIV